jgi:CRISPR-associated protein Csd1
LESNFAWFFSAPPKDDPDRGVRAVKSLYKSVQSGALPAGAGDRFYVLGLSPNAARLAVRLWKVGTIAEFAERIKMHFDDLEIVRGPKEKEFLSLNELLNATALQYEQKNIPPNLAAAVLTSALDGTPYPKTLLQQCLRRIRAERHVTRARAAILKAYLNRFNRRFGNKEEISMALDRTNTSPGYRLGRLFAVLDKIQEEASPGINATIRDRFYGSASSSPVAVFSQLLKLKNHHLAKLGQGRKVFMEKEIGEIMSELRDFPAHLSMDEQARFAIGYYQQRQSFFEKKEANP